MRVAFDDQIFATQRYGGISRYFCRLANELRSIGVEPKIFSPVYQNEYLKQMDESFKLGFFLRRFPPKSTKPILWLNNKINSWAIQAWQPQVIHETYYSPWEINCNNVPRITTIHDMIYEIFPRDFSHKDKTAELKRISVKRADMIVCVSEVTRNDLIRLLNVPPEKTRVVYHGFDDLTQGFDGPNLLPRQAKPYLLFVGNRGLYKNFKALLTAFSSSKRLQSDFDLAVFGGCPPNSDELAFASKLNLDSKKIHYLTGSDQLLGELYRSAAAFVYPSLYEGFGFPPLEAMAAKCPVICSNVSSIPEVVGDAGEYFNPHDVGDIRSAIERVVYSDSRKADLVARGKVRLESFSWKKCSKETYNIYREFIS